MARWLRRIEGRTDGSVAPTVALSLFLLLGAGGVAFDYARMASLDTELQNAADQAALAAASQLDGQTGACARAAAAAANMITNHTVMANESASSVIVVTEDAACDAINNIRFYRDIAKTQPATTDAEAKYVEVIVNPRQATFALTPVVAAFSSVQLTARAFATLGEAYCKTPPIMICNPEETATNTNFNADDYEGVGLRLVSVGASGGWAPGNFGYLDTGGGSNGAPGLREGLGWGTPPGNCLEANGLDTKPGATVTVTDSINTRFDIYTNVSCPTGGTCPSSLNSVKDLVRPANASGGGNSCAMHPNQGWQQAANAYGQGSIPSSASVPLPTTTTPGAMGHPRDMCHAVDPAVAGACLTAIGDGNWDRDAYFRTNYRRADGTYWTGGTGTGSWQDNTGLPADAKRYDVYIWEIENVGDLVDGVTVLGTTPAGATGSTLVAHGAPVCSTAQGMGAGVDPTDPAELRPDRRKIVVAVVNCLEQGVNGNSVNVQVKDWIEVFLVEPSLNRARTSSGDVYAEVIGGTEVNEVQQVEKKVPFLIQ